MGNDATNWDEELYRSSVLEGRAVKARTVFRSLFAPTSKPAPDIVVAASSDGSVAPYSICACISSSPSVVSESKWHQSVLAHSVAEPLCSLSGHNGPAYDLKFYGEGEDSLLLSCGDDGRIQGWKWQEILVACGGTVKCESPLQPMLELKNPQQKGPWDALSPMPETNALATDLQGKRIFSATGNGCAYSWDMETCKTTMAFEGHSDYLHCIAARPSQNQVCGSGGNFLTLWSLPCMDAIIRIATQAPLQDVVIADNQILAVGAQPLVSRFSFGGKILSQVSCAPLSVYSVDVHSSGVTMVGGYGGLVDIISEFGSHLCIFSCKGL